MNLKEGWRGPSHLILICMTSLNSGFLSQATSRDVENVAALYKSSVHFYTALCTVLHSLFFEVILFGKFYISDLNRNLSTSEDKM